MLLVVSIVSLAHLKFCACMCVCTYVFKSWLPVIGVNHNTPWFTCSVDVSEQHTMTCPIGGQFSHHPA